MSSLLNILSLDKHNITLKNIITKLDQELEQLIKDYTSANRYAMASFALRQNSDYAEFLGDTVEQLRNSAFLWRETLKPQFIQSIVIMRSFCTTYIQYFNDVTQELSASAGQVEANTTLLLELFDDTLARLNKILNCLAKLTVSVKSFMNSVAENKKNLTEYVLPNIEKIIEQVHGNLDENFKNLKITLTEYETNMSKLQNSKEGLDRLLDLVKEYLALKPKMTHYQATKDAFQKLLPHFLLENCVQNLGQNWQQLEQRVTQEKEKLAPVASYADSNKPNEENLAAKTVETLKTQDKPITIPTALQASYAFLEKLYGELSYLEKNLRRYELELV